jgi:transcriptional regulator with XRE-family HTH domain
MQLREKLVQLRALAGEQRGLGRPMTQMEVAEALRSELGRPFSQAYLSQLERGKRVHLSNTSREALARFFQVHPGYLVSDLPETTISTSISGTGGSGTSLSGLASLESVPGLGLAPDLMARVQNARQREVSSFPARRYQLRVSPDLWDQRPGPAPRRTRVGIDAQLEDLLSRLRDHPEAERVLVLMEQIVQLPSSQLVEFEKLGRLLWEDRITKG